MTDKTNPAATGIADRANRDLLSNHDTTPARHPRRKNRIAGQFIAHPRTMVESPAMRALSLAARRALDRLEIEHMNHGGAENGKLPVTYRQFEDWGVHRHTVASAIRELEALGFIEITRRGYGGAADMRVPSLYRLTYRPTWNAGPKEGDGTHEYLTIKSREVAEAIAATARRRANPRNVDRGKKQNATPIKCQISPPENGRETQEFSPPISGGTCLPPENGGSIYSFGRRG